MGCRHNGTQARPANAKHLPGHSLIPGAAAPGSTIIQIVEQYSPIPTLSCSQGTCRHSVFKKVHLTFPSPLQTILEAVDSSCINIILRQAVPAVDHSLRKEAKTTVTATTFFHQFPRVRPRSVRSTIQESRAVARKPRDAAGVLFDLKFADR